MLTGKRAIARIQKAVGPPARRVASTFIAEPLECRIMLSIVYVDLNSGGTTHNGSSWTDAYTSLQTALGTATSGETIEVAQGTYLPITSPVRSATFQLINGVTIQGGYPTGGGSSPNPAVYPTILSGNILGNNTGNSYHILTGSATNSTAVLEGFTITGGNADASGDANSGNGAGLYVNNGSPTILDCTFNGNSAVNGGAIYFGACGSTPTLANCVFTSNSAESGAAIENNSSSPTLINCTFTANTAPTGNGGAVFDVSSSSPTLANCILWLDSASSGNEIFNTDSTSSPTVSFSDVDGGYGGISNINSDPQFIRNANPTAGDYGNLQLQQSSPCTDAGNSTLVPAGITTDLQGAPRLTSGMVDMGAYESQAIFNSPATQLVFVHQPNNAAAGAVFSSNIYVVVENQYGYPVTSGSPPVSLSVANSSTANLFGPVILPATQGTATFSNLAMVTAGTFALVASSGSLTSAQSNNFVISAGAASKLVYVQQASGGIINSPVVPPIQLQIEDIYGNIVTSDNSNVTMTLASAPTGGTLSGTSSVAASNGVAVFSDLILNNSGTYTLKASQGTLSAVSTSITETSSTPKVIFVDSIAPGPTHNGTSWTDAYTTLSQALSVATANTVIEIGQGTYTPGTATTSTFQLINNVSLLGGYAGYGTTNPYLRNVAAFPTILSGAGTCYHVVTGNNTNSTAVIDGFTITGGEAKGTTGFGGDGAGMLNSGGSPTINNCIFTANFTTLSTSEGAGMYNSSSSPIITNCTFAGNLTQTTGARGGGMDDESGSSPTLTNCIFNSNIGFSNGGGVFNDSSCSPHLFNCLFIGNTTSSTAGEGGGFFNDQGSPTLINCTFSGNAAGGGGAFYNYEGGMTVTNCICYGDTGYTGEIVTVSSGSGPLLTLSYSDVQGGFTGTNIINVNPLFASTTDFQLQENSPCINAGSNAAVPSTDKIDLAGNPRTVGAAVDLGAYENQAASFFPNLVFDVQPSNTTAGVTMNPAVVVYVETPAGSIISTDESTVTLSSSIGTFAAQAVNGVATFNNVVLDTAGTSMLTATDGIDTFANSNSFKITAAPATQLVIIQAPTSDIIGSVLNSSLAVDVEDGFGNIVTNSTASVSVAVATGPAGGALTGTTTVVPVNGLAIFPNVSVNTPGTFTLAVTSGTLTGATTGDVLVTYAPTQLVFAQEPSNESAGTTFSPNIVVDVEDQLGDIVAEFNSSVSLSMVEGSVGLSGQPSTAALNGVATFSNVRVFTVGNYIIEATSGTLTAAISTGFTISPGPVSGFSFTVEPKGGLIDTDINPPIVLTATDAYGNVATQDNSNIILALSNAPTGSTLGGTTILPFQAGVATFSNITVNTPGLFTLIATQGTLSRISSSFRELPSYTLYVDPQAPGPTDGLSWATAYPSLQQALSSAYASQTVEVAQGTYVPGTSATSTFSPGSGVTVLGGFAGYGEPDPNARNPSVYTTVLSGQGTNNHVLTLTGVGSSTIIDGLTVTDAVGGGILNNESAAIFSDCIIEDNSANGTTGYGAGMSNTQSTPTVINCEFLDNTAQGPQSEAGGIYDDSYSGVNMFNCLFVGNSAVADYGSSGGIFGGRYSTTTVVNCSFYDNSCNDGYAAVYVEGTNSMANCICYGDSGTISEVDYDQVVSFSDIQGGFDGAGNINVNPQYVSNTNFELEPTSPCINAGNNASVPSNITIDLAGDPRIVEGVVDMGAYEYQGNPSFPYLAFASEPASTTAGAVIAPTIVVDVDNQNGDLISSDESTIILSVYNGSNLEGTLTAPAINGVATFPNVIANTAGTYYLVASDGNDNPARSDSFLINPAAASAVVITYQPSGGIINSQLPTLSAEIVDSYGNIESASTQINISIFGGPAGAALSGYTILDTVNNYANFTNLLVNTVGTYTLEASSGALTPALTTSFMVTGSATQIIIAQQPSTEPAGSLFGSLYAVDVEDASGNIVTVADAWVTLSLAASSTNGTLYGTTTIFVNNGVATFPNVNIQEAGTYYLTATSTSLTSVTSSSITITPLSASQLVFTQQPSGTIVDSPITPPIVVTAEDQYGNTATSDNSNIALAVASGPSGALLGGTTVVATQNGVATFTDVIVNTAGVYSLSATQGAITGYSLGFGDYTTSVLYVDAAARGPLHDGLSWATAYANLQQALGNIYPGLQTIEVAQGTYYPGTSSSSTFVMSNGVTLLGGYAGNALANPNARNVTAYTTILSGAGTCQYVVTSDGTNSTAVLDGFTLTGATEAALFDLNGGPTVSNCSFTGNDSPDGAVDTSGAFNDSSSPTFINCAFTNNSVGDFSVGGDEGYGNGGGGMYNYLSTVTLVNCLFEGNTANTQFAACGGVFDASTNITVINCTFTNNKPITSAGGYGAICTFGPGIATLINTICYGDSAVETYGSAIITYSDIEGGYTGTGNINTNPLFASTSNLELQGSSPCINAGSNAGLPLGDTTDLAGYPRVMGTAVDMGVYEFQPFLWTGLGDGVSWNNLANWAGGSVPTRTSYVIIPTGANVQLGSGASSCNSLTIQGDGSLDLGSGSLTLDYGTASPQSIIQSYIANGSIFSSFVNSNPIYGIAYADGADGVVSGLPMEQFAIEPALLGDTDLNGTVNIHDLQNLLTNFNAPGSWDQGNFNGQAAVNIGDLQALLDNYDVTSGVTFSDSLLAPATPPVSGSPLAIPAASVVAVAAVPTAPLPVTAPISVAEPVCLTRTSLTVNRSNRSKLEAAGTSGPITRRMAVTSNRSPAIAPLFSDSPITASWLQSEASVLDANNGALNPLAE
jgi:Protein of unknown function (DUF1565)